MLKLLFRPRFNYVDTLWIYWVLELIQAGRYFSAIMVLLAGALATGWAEYKLFGTIASKPYTEPSKRNDSFEA